MIDLKVKCTICGKEESNKELIKEIAGIVKKYNMKSEQYLDLLNIMNGKCLDSDIHSFIFDETFVEKINEVVVKHKDALTETESLRNDQRNTIKEMNDLNVKMIELKSKEESINQKLQNTHETITSLNEEIENSTGYNNINIWNLGLD